MNNYFFIKLRSIGDTVILTSSVSAVIKNNPDARIDMLIPAGTGFLFKKNPHVDKIFTIDITRNKWLQFFHFIKQIRKVRFKKYDFVLNFHANYLSAILARLVSAKYRGVYNQGMNKKNLFSDFHVTTKGQIKSFIEKDYDLLRAVGIEVSEVYVPKIFFDESNKRKTNYLHKRVIGIHPGASKKTKKWALENYIELIKSIKDKYCIKVLYSEFEAKEVGLIKNHLSSQNTSGLDFCKTDTLEQMALMLRNVDLFFVMDSGPKHIGVAVDVPTITLFGGESMGEFHPYDKQKHLAIREDVPCRPNYADKKGFEWCGLSECESMLCMKKIKPNRIVNEIDNFFKTGKFN